MTSVIRLWDVSKLRKTSIKNASFAEYNLLKFNALELQTFMRKR